jgi:hypothetical protein
MNWLICQYCGNEWEAVLFRGPPPCSKCKEKKNIRVLKRGETHNKYYEDDPKEEVKIEYPDYQD